MRRPAPIGNDKFHWECQELLKLSELIVWAYSKTRCIARSAFYALQCRFGALLDLGINTLRAPQQLKHLTHWILCQLLPCHCPFFLLPSPHCLLLHQLYSCSWNSHFLLCSIWCNIRRCDIMSSKISCCSYTSQKLLTVAFALVTPKTDMD